MHVENIILADFSLVITYLSNHLYVVSSVLLTDEWKGTGVQLYSSSGWYSTERPTLEGIGGKLTCNLLHCVRWPPGGGGGGATRTHIHQTQPVWRVGAAISGSQRLAERGGGEGRGGLREYWVGWGGGGGGCPTPEPPKILFVVLNNRCRITENCVLTRVFIYQCGIICGKFMIAQNRFLKFKDQGSF